MDKIILQEITLAGISLNKKTTNENGQSGIDCGSLWQKFEKENVKDQIPGKLSDEVLAVYHQYEGDYTKPFSYFIGCKVKAGTEAPDGIERLIIQEGVFQRIRAKGKMPDCVENAWKEIWKSGIPRAYQADF